MVTSSDPQEKTKSHEFRPPETTLGKQMDRKIVMKKKQTFIIEIVDTKDSTWQGKVNWVNGKKEQTFRSVMELLRLVDSVVAEGEEGYLGGKTF